MRQGSSRFGNSPLIRSGDHRAMPIDSTGPTAAAALAARDRVALAAKDAAHDERSTARFAQTALFEEALLSALKSRFAELRTAAK